MIEVEFNNASNQGRPRDKGAVCLSQQLQFSAVDIMPR